MKLGKEGGMKKNIIDTPTIFEKLLFYFDPEGFQNDCQEFLQHVLDSLQKELIQFDMNKKKIEENPTKEPEDWVEVGKGKKQMVYNNDKENSNLVPTVLTKIFGGIYKNEFKLEGRSQISITFQPFFLLNLDITKEKTLEASLEHFFKVEEINGKSIIFIFRLLRLKYKTKKESYS